MEHGIRDKIREILIKCRTEKGLTQTEVGNLVGKSKNVIDILGTGAPDERIVKYANPSSISKCFIKLRDKLELKVRFHDLRHYFVSIGAVLKIPDTYLSDFGGFKRGSGVMKEVYQNNITSMSDYYADRMNEHFNDLMKKV